MRIKYQLQESRKMCLVQQKKGRIQFKEFQNMNKTAQHSYKASSEGVLSGNNREKTSFNSLMGSPFSKNLAVIFQTESSPHKNFSSSNVDYLQEKYQSRLVEDESHLQSNCQFSQTIDSYMMTVREKQLLNRIYDKQRQLVMLEERIFLLKNSNECLRQTIQEEKVQKGQMLQQIEILHKNIAILTSKQNQIRQKLEAIQFQYRQQQQFYQFHNIRSQSELEIVKQNAQLKTQIQNIKLFYEEEIYQIINRNEASLAYMEQNLQKTQHQNTTLSQANQILSQQMRAICSQLKNNKEQKLQTLQYYLEIIQDMKDQIQDLKRQSHIASEHIINSNSLEYDEFMHNSRQNISVSQSMNNSIDIAKYLQDDSVSQWLARIVKNHIKSQKNVFQQSSTSQSLLKSLQKSGSIFSSQNCEKQLTNPLLKSALLSQKQVQRHISRNQGALPVKEVDFPNSTLLKNSKTNKFQNFSNRSPTDRILSKDSKMQRSRQTKLYNKKHQKIDDKLEQIKQRLTKELYRTNV